MSHRRGGNGNVEESLKRELGESSNQPTPKRGKKHESAENEKVKIPTVAELNGNEDSDDDLFEELNSTVNRKILKCDALEKDTYYLLTDIYTIKVENRLSFVGGFKKEDDEESTYIWLPAALSRHYTEEKVARLKSSILKGKKGYIIFRGMKDGVYGKMYDIKWEKKPNN